MYNYRKRLFDGLKNIKINIKPITVNYQTYVTLSYHKSGICTYQFKECTSNYDSLNLDAVDCIPYMSYMSYKPLNKFNVGDSVVIYKQSTKINNDIIAVVENEESIGIILKKTNIKLGKFYYSAYEVLIGNIKNLLLEELLESSVT